MNEGVDEGIDLPLLTTVITSEDSATFRNPYVVILEGEESRFGMMVRPAFTERSDSSSCVLLQAECHNELCVRGIVFRNRHHWRVEGCVLSGVSYSHSYSHSYSYSYSYSYAYSYSHYDAYSYSYATPYLHL